MRQTLAALFLFGVSFGYVEAAVVAYLRAIYDPIRQQLHPERPKGDLFPLITPEQLRAAGGPENTRRLAIEIGREAATMLMLAAVGLAVARDSQQWLAAFLIGFGVWDISFYAFLRLIIDWPGSWLTWDLLFLLPVPWVGPVIAPILVSLTMIFCGVAALRRKIRIRALHWLAIISGGFIIILAFCWDFKNTSAGGLPNPFNWPLLGAGELAGVTGFLAAVRNSQTTSAE
jgi:hypothetical protein